MDTFKELCDWYVAQCDGDWEHGFGVSIETLDNPGWWVRINLRDTVLENVFFASVEEGDSDDDNRWINCKNEPKWKNSLRPHSSERARSRPTVSIPIWVSSG